MVTYTYSIYKASLHVFIVYPMLSSPMWVTLYWITGVKKKIIHYMSLWKDIATTHMCIANYHMIFNNNIWLHTCNGLLMLCCYNRSKSLYTSFCNDSLYATCALLGGVIKFSFNVDRAWLKWIHYTVIATITLYYTKAILMYNENVYTLMNWKCRYVRSIENSW